MRIDDRIFAVTGAGSGIGREIALRFASAGGRIAALDLNPETAAETVGMLEGDGHFSAALDVADGDAVTRVFAQLRKEMGGLDGLVNNAGVEKVAGDGREELMKSGQQMVHSSHEAFSRLMAINVNGVFFCLQAAARCLQQDERPGSVINMSSIAGLSANGTVAYSASKSAVLGITRASARELGRFGIRVNAVCPGVIDTPMTAGVPEQALKPLLGATPLGRIGQPADIAAAALFLASDESSFITGQWISPNGGLLMC